MSELTEVLSAAVAGGERGERMALATIVAARGSTYRRPGARLLIREHGTFVGNISGGCVEGEVERLARRVMEDGQPHLTLLDLTADGDEVWGYGLGCNGAMEVFLEPADAALATAKALLAAIEEERTCCLVTVLESRRDDITAGGRLLVLDDGTTTGGLGVPDVDAALERLAQSAMEEGTREVHEVEALRVFAEAVEPPPRLIVCGAGHDAIPLVALASRLGWRVTVADPRRKFLDPERFPDAVGFVDSEPSEIGRAIGGGTRTSAVLMTHNYLRDLEYLRALLEIDLEYLGALGPRKRSLQLLRELDRVDAIDRVHAPAGLDLGSENPDEVALAIVAELVAVHRGRGGGSLRERRGPIHDRASDDETGRTFVSAARELGAGEPG